MSQPTSPDLNKPLPPTPEEVETLNDLTSTIAALRAELVTLKEDRELVRDCAGW